MYRPTAPPSPPTGCALWVPEHARRPGDTGPELGGFPPAPATAWRTERPMATDAGFLKKLSFNLI